MTKERKPLDEMLKQEAEDPELERLREQLYQAEQRLKEYSERDAEYESLENELKKTKREFDAYRKRKEYEDSGKKLRRLAAEVIEAVHEKPSTKESRKRTHQKSLEDKIFKPE